MEATSAVLRSSSFRAAAQQLQESAARWNWAAHGLQRATAVHLSSCWGSRGLRRRQVRGLLARSGTGMGITAGTGRRTRDAHALAFLLANIGSFQHQAGKRCASSTSWYQDSACTVHFIDPHRSNGSCTARHNTPIRPRTPNPAPAPAPAPDTASYTRYLGVWLHPSGAGHRAAPLPRRDPRRPAPPHTAPDGPLACRPHQHRHQRSR